MAKGKYPISIGAICGIQVIIPICPICGGSHVHGGSDHSIGDLTHRVSHCLDRSLSTGSYWIFIVEEIPENQYKKYMNTHLSRPRKAMITPERITEAEAKRRYKPNNY